MDDNEVRARRDTRMKLYEAITAIAAASLAATKNAPTNGAADVKGFAEAAERMALAVHSLCE